MKKRNFLTSKLFFLLFAITLLVSSCIKNNNFIKGDAKIRVFHVASTDTTQNFFLNGRQLGSAATYGTNSSYIVVAGDSTYKITSRNINSANDLTTLAAVHPSIGKNYSVYYTRKSTTAAPELIYDEDDVRPNPDSAKVVFWNLGYTLGSPVIVTDSGNAFSKLTMVYGNKLTRKIKVNKSTKISFVLTTPTTTNPQPVVTLLDSTTISNGRVYTVIIDGSRTGELQKRLVSSN
ncbi:DUF4397 domain-containing protein [Pedobacter chinensis]|uniref:DUF4397 domain-containing protein n=1 Tax=Pedobacter chinensis TaxID=2282421 RepID=A0A369PSL2_9SPHI|nr:DUF4397 domain-containing protein [Pedobacter chinensis]RDC55504.1 DUF4397 domain-containing protein [Pedobacter chinensis]